MAIMKYSRQRECIKAYLANTNEHPTADTVYLHVKENFPNISLGTVYRNLNLLADIGEAMKITTPDGADRFDGVTTPHYHVLCTECGNIYDLDMEISDAINIEAQQCFDGQILSHSALFYGTCGVCCKQKKENLN